MNFELEVSSIVTGAVSLLVFALSGLSSTSSIARRLIGKIKNTAIYEDEDGVATEASIRAFSDTWQRLALAMLSAIWFGCALCLTIITLIPPQSQLLVPFWLLVGNSVSSVLCVVNYVVR